MLEEVQAAQEETKPLPFDQAVARADEIPGVDVVAAREILAETGTDMSQFPSEHHLASWTRICPGNNESAGKRKTGKTGRGNRWLRRILTQVAWAASRTKRTYFAGQFRRIAKRRGKKRAIIAVAHSILIALYHMLKYDRHYHELGEDFFDRLDPERVTRYHVGRLQDLGYEVTLTKAPVAA
jgi:transposase